jgi:hypothetical protein
VRVNGIEMPVRINDIELLKALAAEVEKRRAEMGQPDPTLASASYVAELLSQGADQNDLRLRAALEIAADMAIRSMVVDMATRQLRIDGFSEQAALASAYFSGLPSDQFQVALQRVQSLNQVAEQTSKQLAQRARAGGADAGRAAAMIAPAPAEAPKAVPVQRAFKARRR